MSKKWALLAPTFVALSAAAQAQNIVTLYGVMDAAVAIEDTGDPGTSTRKAVNSGNQSSSRIGIRGSEDLGAGLKAVFNLESGVAADTGAAEAAFWGRRAVVGLEGGFGSVTLGREYSPLAAVAGSSDIFGQGFFGTNLSAFSSTRITRRLSNALSYRTPTFAGLTASFAGSASENVPGSSRILGTALEFKSGRLYAAGGYHDAERVDGVNTKEYGLGVGYGFDNVDFKGNYLVADPGGVAGRKFEQLNVGASLGLGNG